MSALAGKTVALGVGGGIAAYRACELARLFMKRGAAVRVAMTRAAQEFVSALTFQALTGHPVLTDLFDTRQDESFGHLATARAADLYAVAPATADLLARIHAGMADDPVTASVLAARGPVLLAPAMNCAMWENELTQRNVRALLALERFHQVGPNVGALADGETGPGRLAEPQEIVEAAEALLLPKDLRGVKVVVTAGPTREHLDPVRFISNPSSGRMGFAIARAAAQRGAQVTLIAGPTSLKTPPGVECLRVTSAEEMARAVLAALSGAQLFVAAAAVADQRPKARLAQKAKKGPGEETLVLERTPDILEASASFGPALVRVGFAAETERLLDNARAKLQRKRLDLIAANDVTEEESGFASQNAHLTLLDRLGGVEALASMDKDRAAHTLLDRARALLPANDAAR